MIISDSLLRPVLQGLTEVPKDWFVNCTPGATFADLSKEIEGVGLPPAVERVVVVCGTNYGESPNMVRVSSEMRRLYSTILEKSSTRVLVRIMVDILKKKFRTLWDCAELIPPLYWTS